LIVNIDFLVGSQIFSKFESALSVSIGIIFLVKKQTYATKRPAEVWMSAFRKGSTEQIGEGLMCSQDLSLNGKELSV